MADTVVVTAPESSESQHDPVEDLRSRLEDLERRLQSIDDRKADREHKHEELMTAIEDKAPAEHEHDAYVTHDELGQVEDELDDLTLELEEDIRDDLGFDEAPIAGTEIGPGPEAGEETRHKPGMLI